MNNVILSIIAKISAMDAESKQLAAQVRRSLCSLAR